MSDWLERELARGLAPVAAPAMLRVRLGLAPAKRWQVPRVALVVAAAVVLVIGGGYAASRTAAHGLRQVAVRESRGARTERAQLPGARLLRCDGGPERRFPASAGSATVLLAHAASPAEGASAWKIPDHAFAATPDAGCHLCHSL